MSRQILNGWKEISNYIERGVRTAQRWEALLGMPVHRPALKDRSAVVAFTDELDRWLSRTAPEEHSLDDRGPSSLSHVQENLRGLAQHSAAIADQARLLREQLQQSRDNQKKRAEARAQAKGGGAPPLTGSVVTFKPVRPSNRAPSYR